MAVKLLDESARGVYIIAATPFTDDGELDLDSTDRLTDFYLEHGVDGITILGVLGEAPKLSAAESVSLAERVLKRGNGRVQIIVGASSPGNRNLRTFAAKMMDLGAAGVMVSPIAGLKTEEQVEAYFAGVVKELGPNVPIVLQDYPQLTSVFMSASLINKML